MQTLTTLAAEVIMGNIQRPDYNDSGDTNQWVLDANRDWMRRIPDHRRLADISMINIRFIINLKLPLLSPQKMKIIRILKLQFSVDREKIFIKVAEFVSLKVQAGASKKKVKNSKSVRIPSKGTS